MAARRGLRAGREPDRKGRDHLLFGGDRRSRRVPLVGAVDVAVRHSLDALLHAHSLIRALKEALSRDRRWRAPPLQAWGARRRNLPAQGAAHMVASANHHARKDLKQDLKHHAGLTAISTTAGYSKRTVPSSRRAPTPIVSPSTAASSIARKPARSSLAG